LTPVPAFVRDNAPFLTAGLLISFTSSYGQTFFIALFAGEVMTEYGLTDGEWGAVYALATIASAGAMVFAGVITDRIRIRALAALTGFGLAGACLAMAASGHWVALAATIFALRFFGQGMMSHLAAVAMARWFVASRGKALAIAATGFAIGQAVLPAAFVAASGLLDWRLLWVVAAGMVLLAVPAILRLLRAERTPRSLAAGTQAAGMDGRHWTRAELLRQPIFWTLVPLLLGPPAFGTALFFHQVHLAATKGWDLIAYVALMPLLTAVSVGATILSGLALDRFGSTRLMQFYLLPFAAAFAVMAWAETLWGAAAALSIFGLGTGLQATLPPAAWAELCGTRHLGAIKAMAAAVMVLGSAIGPGLTGWVIDAGIDFSGQMGAIVAYFAAAGLLATWGLRRAVPRLAPAPEIDIVRP
jgi:MFS family permease